MEDNIEGGMNRVAGRVQSTVGAAAGDAGVQMKGKLPEAAGRLQQGYGDALDAVRVQTAENPMLTVAIAAGVGFVLGAFWASRD